MIAALKHPRPTNNRQLADMELMLGIGSPKQDRDPEAEAVTPEPAVNENSPSDTNFGRSTVPDVGLSGVASAIKSLTKAIERSVLSLRARSSYNRRVTTRLRGELRQLRADLQAAQVRAQVAEERATEIEVKLEARLSAAEAAASEAVQLLQRITLTIYRMNRAGSNT
jgi:biotin synthase-related radical SAM superfamily protein